MKKLLKISILLAGGIIFALFLGEILIRIIKPHPLYSFEKGLFMKSVKYGYCLTPNAVKRHTQPEYSYVIHANSYGFRGKDPDLNAEYRVLVLGDSFGMAQGVEEGQGLCEQTENRFLRDGINLNIFNTSIAGYSGTNEVMVLQNIAPIYKPDLVVLLFCKNDIGARKSLDVQNGYLVLRKCDNVVFRLREWLNNHSQLFCAIKSVCYARKSQKTGMGSGRVYSEEDIRIAVSYIRRMKRICDQWRAGFIVVILPDSWRGPADSRQLLTSLIEAESISTEDWGQYFDNLDEREFVFELDRHWTAKGHARTGQMLYDLIKSKLDM